MQLYVDKYKNILSYLIADELTVTQDLCLWLLFGQEKLHHPTRKAVNWILQLKFSYHPWKWAGTLTFSPAYTQVCQP